ncbi:MAG: hypothetical protein U9Q85_04175 [Patescibacteria group bacterium]|nr:hypothetical protein [Patescibacteria group bacterium]
MTKVMAKKTKPKEEKNKKEVISKKEEIKQKLSKASDDVVKKVDSLKKKFDKADPETKKKIITGISAAAAGLVVLAGLGKRKGKK